MGAGWHRWWRRVHEMFETPPRWSAVPWLSQTDLETGERAEWEVEYQPDQDRATCWPVRLYDREGMTRVYLFCHATRGNGNDGGRITLSISEHPHFDVYARETFAIAQTNPQRPRHQYRTDADCFRDDGA